MLEKTFVAIKPDGVKRGLIGDIVKRFEQRGLKIIGMKMVWINSDFAKKHYALHVDKSFYTGLEKYMTSGPVVGMVVEGLHAVEIVRKIVGSTEPKSAPIGTIRGDYAHESYAYSDDKGKSLSNLIHASGNTEEANQEISLWFSQEEVFNYKKSDWDVMHEPHD